MITLDDLTTTAQSFHSQMVTKYTEQGMSEADAIEQADLELIAWSQPLELPESEFGDEEWFDA